MGVAIGLEFWPARVTLPSGTELWPVKLYVVDGRVHVYIWSNDSAVLYFDEEFVSAAGSKIVGFTIETSVGTLTASKDRGCGCGHPLKRYNPWPTERRELVKL